MVNSCPRNFSTGGAGVKAHRYDLMVPKRDNEGHDLKTGVVNYFAREMARHFGGSTVVDGQGCWKRDDRVIQCEPVKVVTGVRIYEIENDDPCTIWTKDDMKMEQLSNEIAQFFGQAGVFGFVTELASTFFTQGEDRPRVQPELLA